MHTNLKIILLHAPVPLLLIAVFNSAVCLLFLCSGRHPAHGIFLWRLCNSAGHVYTAHVLSLVVERLCATLCVSDYESFGERHPRVALLSVLLEVGAGGEC